MHATTFTKSDLQKLGIDPLQDMVFCAFDDVTDTLFAILSLRALFPEISIIALSDSRENSRKLRYAGAERVIDLYEEAANQMLCRLTRPALNRAIDDILYRQGGVKMVEIEIPEQSPCDGKHLREIDFKSRGLILLAIVDQSKKSKLLITDRSIDQRVYAGELLIIIGKEEDLQRFRERLSPAAHPMGMPV
jgi:voltage-gated potassium channel